MEHDDTVGSKRRRHGGPSRLQRFFRSVFYSAGYVTLVFRRALKEDAQLVWDHGRLFLGGVLLLSGLLSFSSDRYCDGSANSYATCMRPAPYYFYDATAIFFVILGAGLIALWWLNRNERGR